MTDAAKTVRQRVEQSRAQIRARHLAALQHRLAEALERHPRLNASVYLFGSWASGRFDAESDTDLLAVVPNGADRAEVERRLMEVADDVVVVSDSQWHERLARDDSFWRQLALERLLLVDTRSDHR